MNDHLLGLWFSVLAAHLNHLEERIQTPNVLYVDTGDVYMDILCKNSSDHTLRIYVFYCLKKIKTLIPKPNSRPIKSEFNMQRVKTIVLGGEFTKKKKKGSKSFKTGIKVLYSTIC